jgi:hypothetical protein
MFWMDGVVVESGLRLELAVENYIAGVVHAAAVHANLQVQQSWDAAPQAEEALRQSFDVALFG